MKRSDGVHLTIGQSSVLRVIYAFARRPSIHDGRGEAARVRAPRTRSARAGGSRRTAAWSACRSAGRRGRDHRRDRAVREPSAACSCTGDASPDLALLCGGADQHLSRRADRAVQSGTAGTWWRACCATRPSCRGSSRALPTSTPSSPTRSSAWRRKRTGSAGPACPPPASAPCAGGGAVRQAARLRRSLPAEQLFTVRYETLIERPAATASAISEFVGVSLPAAQMRELRKTPTSVSVGGWRGALSPESGRRRGNDRGRGTPPGRLRPIRRPPPGLRGPARLRLTCP
jgi:hypothetical protein